MCTVFGFGTALFGAGAGRGAILTAVHILLLTTYYWTLSPIGLPSHGEWLDPERTWITGLPVYFAVYFLGYLTALWIWYRRQNRSVEKHEPRPAKRFAVSALITAAAIVVVLGLAQTVMMGEFPGVTWFIVRLAISFPFILAWRTVTYRGQSFYLPGGVCLALLLAAYSHYLAPIGLPNPSLRVIAENPPPIGVHWLSYRDEFLILLPVTMASTIIGFLLLNRFLLQKTSSEKEQGMSWLMLIPPGILLVMGIIVFEYVGPEARTTHIAAEGGAQIEQGEYLSGSFVDAAATIEMTVENVNNHRTPLPPHNKVALRAVIADAGGRAFEVVSNQPW